MSKVKNKMESGTMEEKGREGDKQMNEAKLVVGA